ncbi:DUF3301 domain-containing protein [Pontibacter sp. JAM-7]|uniref:DUF3301 domain-containing protein n=1 Tax=Pontibacter sp. JAM-7 TaxID=3366581 RepID=UPI003AF6844D
MYIDLTALFWLTLMALMILHWWQSQQVKEIALRHTSKHCRELDLQFLDESISLRAIWLKRDNQGRIRFWRAYNFEFSSTGEERYTGRVVTLGRQVIALHLQPHRIH